jgi:hypothetical protein
LEFCKSYFIFYHRFSAIKKNTFKPYFPAVLEELEVWDGCCFCEGQSRVVMLVTGPRE